MTPTTLLVTIVILTALIALASLILYYLKSREATDWKNLANDYEHLIDKLQGQ